MTTCNYCHRLFDPLKNQPRFRSRLLKILELTPDGGKTWQFGGIMCQPCRDYLMGLWRYVTSKGGGNVNKGKAPRRVKRRSQ